MSRSEAVDLTVPLLHPRGDSKAARTKRSAEWMASAEGEAAPRRTVNLRP